ncbi:copper chaperone PCu(A)C [Nonomuraea polychroma]|uniref:copper chaperone PCu(A)C n=1 Tax=Nonomuraea polychroma TaxID=46176 RepID=UPI003D8B4845
MFSRINVATVRVVTLSIIAAAALSACGSQQQSAPTASAAAASPAAPATTATTSAASALTITDPWVKTAKKGMSAAFGTLVNNSDADVVVLSGTTPLSPRVELHEVVESKGKMVMQPKKGGFVIPAHGSHALKPGGDHIMLMDIVKEVQPGAEVSFTLTLKDGDTFTFTALGKDFAGAKEDYQPGMDMGGDNG